MNFISKLREWYFTKNALPYWCVLILDCLILLFSGILCYYLDHGGSELTNNFWPLLGTLCVYLIAYLIGIRLMHTYQAIIRYSSFVDLTRIASANAIGFVIIAIARYCVHVDRWLEPVRIRELFFTFLIATLMMTALRVVVKMLYDSMHTGKATRVFIYGTHSGGVGLAKMIRSTKPSRFVLKGFVSDTVNGKGKYMMGVEIFRNDAHLVDEMKKENADALLVSPLKSEELRKNTEMINSLVDNDIKLFVLAGAQEWDGKSNLEHSQIKEVDIEDLLPREKIEVDMKAVGNLLSGKRILITGAAGSIGSEMVRQIAIYQPNELILVDQAETPLHDVRLMMAKKFPQIKAFTLMASIQNKPRMEEIFAEHRPDFVFHAAAYKHVPMMEDNPSESVQNNVDGTRVIADLSVKYGVKKFVMISTDKAVNPTSVMGASKRLAEMVIQNMNLHSNTRFAIVRFGNVLGSRGSVVPLFKKQIAKGGPITITDPEMVRYFMTIPEAAQLVLQAGTFSPAIRLAASIRSSSMVMLPM